jgi:Tol biopolymer transport system component
MRTVALSTLVALLIGCGTTTNSRSSPLAVPAFERAVNVGTAANSADFDGGPSVSEDGLLMYFISDRKVSRGGDIWMATRSSTAEPFGRAVNLGAQVNSSSNEGAPSISADGLELFFDRSPDGRIFVATRLRTSDPFGLPQVVDLGRSQCCDSFPDISGNGLELYFCSDRPGGAGGDDVWVARRTTRSSPFGAPVNVGASVNSGANDCQPSLSKDGSTLYIGSDRAGGSGNFDIWVSVRAGSTGAFGAAVNLGSNVNGLFADERPDISADGATLYFMSNRPGGSGFFDLWLCQKVR